MIETINKLIRIQPQLVRNRREPTTRKSPGNGHAVARSEDHQDAQDRSPETPIGEEEDSHLGDSSRTRSCPRPRTRSPHNLREQIEEAPKSLTNGKPSSENAFRLATAMEHTLEKSASSSGHPRTDSVRSKPKPCASSSIHAQKAPLVHERIR
jgi:DNA-directed RNA polymerase sigma subunit (sigma70/sigma32)